jgi:hypothetical protein
LAWTTVIPLWTSTSRFQASYWSAKELVGLAGLGIAVMLPAASCVGSAQSLPSSKRFLAPFLIRDLLTK